MVLVPIFTIIVVLYVALSLGSLGKGWKTGIKLKQCEEFHISKRMDYAVLPMFGSYTAGCKLGHWMYQPTKEVTHDN
jgi:hypothetical protein